MISRRPHPRSLAWPTIAIAGLTIGLVSVLALGAGRSPADATVTTATDPATTVEQIEQSFVVELNVLRAEAGLDPMVEWPSLARAAQNWTQAMVAAGTLRHAGDITAGAPSGWTKAGENVGRGPSVPALVSAFMASPTHRANILDPAFNRIGVAVVVASDGRLYTTHRFAATVEPAPVGD